LGKQDKGDPNIQSNQIAPTSNKNFAGLIITISIIANVIILLLFFAPSIGYKGDVAFDITVLPRFNAVFNSFTFIFLLAALIAIIKRNVKLHKRFILAAFSTTLLFLVTYLSFHYLSPETSKYGGEGIIRSIYFFILITHSILAAIIVPLALFTLVWGWTNQLKKHRKIARWTMPIWLYVSSTGVVVYLMMAPYY
jgi:putative membrane protein